MADESTDILLDEFGDLALDEGGDAAVIDDPMDVFIQDIRHRLMTVKGSLAADPDYGGNLPLFLHKDLTAHFRLDLQNTLALELSKESRILPQRTQFNYLELTRTKISLVVLFIRKTDLAQGEVGIEVGE